MFHAIVAASRRYARQADPAKDIANLLPDRGHLIAVMPPEGLCVRKSEPGSEGGALPGIVGQDGDRQVNIPPQRVFEELERFQARNENQGFLGCK